MFANESDATPLGQSAVQALKKTLDMKPAYQRSIFISYQWDQQGIAQALQSVFESKRDARGNKKYLVIRDEGFLGNDEYIKDFMKIVAHPKLDYVLPIISKQYLLSRNCMYEVNQMMRRYDWERSLLP